MRRKVLSSEAQHHVNLLSDPCHAALCHPLYPGAEAGIVMRFTTLVNVNVGGSNDAGAFLWSPGAAKANTGYVVGGGTAMTLTDVAANVPGNSFFNTNSCSYRCVAGCLEAFTDSSEMNRSGYFGLTNTTQNYFTGDMPTPATILNSCTTVVRTPNKQVGILWLPNVGDMSYGDYETGSTPSGEGPGLNSSNIWFAWAGHQAGVAITLKLTAVYEVQFKTAGIPSSITRNVSSDGISDVLAEFWRTHKDTIITAGVQLASYAVKYGAEAVAAM